ncbi:hypothetical protein FLJC2902T_13470 [Flavobacterium limnosediminis JC2902]|uniref:Methylamine utilisation protein MauE domain-containing protein n=1 Tax=Flavobacterium limnosediminis JC2902 TaxID=1341181 RepID=V6SRE6_9FLAO|nr:MauE/DoxX family redox-associated membrane protein [Flavobacterium limnosediminis]ESU28752.1 hypothetical protein FLJC2902T_13470 [Flavobacterium limnosediminis JC2902]
MSLSVTFRRNLVELISFLFILLFVYAAVNKILDFENFQVQLGQSPLLSAFAGWVSFWVLIVEIIVAVFLIFNKYRFYALTGSFMLMVMFTIYIIIILNFSPFVPCSCGGILEKMTWKQHLFFNILFVFLAIAGMLLTEFRKFTIKRKFLVVSGGFFLSVSIITILFLLSEDMIHNRNNFVRRFPHHPVNLQKEFNLKYDSYYLAGLDGEKVYLGNVTAPRIVTTIDLNSGKEEIHTIELPKNSFKFSGVKVIVKPPYFYLTDGTVPCVFRGRTSDWKASLWSNDAYFTQMRPMDSVNVAIRAISSLNHQNVIGTINFENRPKVSLSSTLLTKQIDGMFDTDGTLLYNRQLNQIVYTYFYRNEFFTANKNLKLLNRFHTIDTNSRVKLKVAYIKSLQEIKMASPPRDVNKTTATYGNYLFVHAALMGKYEPKEMWRKASIIDVYNLLSGSYVFSFYLPNKSDFKMSEYIVEGDLLVAITGNYLSIYKIKTTYYDNSTEKYTAQYQGTDRKPEKE